MVRQIARDALDMLDTQGWTQGVCEDEHGICLGTALCRAAGLPEDGKLTPGQLATWVALTDAVLAAQQVLFPDAPFDTTNVVPMLNDHSSREDVQKILEVIAGDGYGTVLPAGSKQACSCGVTHFRGKV